MIKPCVILDGQVINIGPWDYQIQTVEKTPPQFDEDGNLVSEAEYEEVVNNPLPVGAVLEDRDIEQDEDGGFRVVGTVQPESSAQKIARLELELAAAQQKQDLMQSALDDLILGGMI